MSYWYCQNCKTELDPKSVTYTEHCDFCGHTAVWIDGDISVDRLTEICTAEREGRCVVLPCKVGDTVYIAYRDGIDEDEIDCFTVDKHGHVWFKMLNSMWTDGYAHFGKTVFLTREEAEAALERSREWR